MTTSVEIRRIIDREYKIMFSDRFNALIQPTIYSDARKGASRRYKLFYRMTRQKAIEFVSRLVDVITKEGYEVTKSDIVSAGRSSAAWYPVVFVRDHANDAAI